MRILVVDDDNAEFIGDLLESEGHSVVAVEDGGEAMAQLASERFDLVITDVMHPGPGGHRIARESVARGTPTFLMNAGRYDPCPEGAVCFSKPFDVDWFLDTVAAVGA